MGASDQNAAAPTQVGTGADGQPIYQGNLNDGSSPETSSGGEPAGDDGGSTDSASSDAGPAEGAAGSAGEGGGSPVDTGDATFVGAEPAQNPDVVPVAGDSAEDPNLGEAGDPAMPPEQFDAPPQEYVSPLFGPKPTMGPDDAWDGQWLEEDARRAERLRRQRTDATVDLNLAPDIDDHGATFADPRARPDAAPPARSWLLPAAAVAGLVLLGAVGVAATRPGAPAAPAAGAPFVAPTLPPTQTVARTAAPTIPPVSALRVTDTRIDSSGNECLDHATLSVTVQVDGAKPGDVVVFVLSGPGLPSTVSATLDAKGMATATLGAVGPVKGTNTWTVGVQSIGGDGISGRAPARGRVLPE